MANKRMFSLDIVDSDAFLDMPVSSQALYFHLGMRADDDGVVDNPRKVVKMCNASIDDLLLLSAKKFIIPIENASNRIIVIKHWKMNNSIRVDRYKPSNYAQLLDFLELDENGAYTLKAVKKELKCTESVQIGIPNDNQMDTQYSIGKDSIDKYNKYTCSNELRECTDSVQLFNLFWIAYPRKIGKDKCYKWFTNKSRNIDQNLVNTMIDSINKWKRTKQWTKDNGKYIPYPYTWLNRGGWNDEIDENDSFSSSCNNTDITFEEA